jgi:hypothetical protein
MTCNALIELIVDAAIFDADDEPFVAVPKH